MYNKCNYIVLIICSILITTLFSALQKQSPLQLPYIDEYKLDNGMRILISPNYDYPTVYCHLYINSGIVDDTLYGGTLAKSTFWAMFHGTKKYPTGKQIREKIRELKENPQNKLQEFLERFEEESFEDFEKYEDGDEKKFLLN